jgi:hypothetical protein
MTVPIGDLGTPFSSDDAPRADVAERVLARPVGVPGVVLTAVVVAARPPRASRDAAVAHVGAALVVDGGLDGRGAKLSDRVARSAVPSPWRT